ncbi:unnamed protein product [Darwinula stevensoni]|uniref:Homeobox domain-containing protein n=1 Tax=Darwinula stevensoni TaxID=69355 RepID=A0A7R9A7F5_9CRUS|nr:unnamed protein product [Darwinula stevensoni]CAG0891567.1 unnamed protein product [Darwinula stevensoni]
MDMISQFWLPSSSTHIRSASSVLMRQAATGLCFLQTRQQQQQAISFHLGTGTTNNLGVAISTHTHQQRIRIRTSFDPEMELPRLQLWFNQNPHPSRAQLQMYVQELNALDSRRTRKPLDVTNVMYWFKNARAAQKRAELKHQPSPGSSSNHTHPHPFCLPNRERLIARQKDGYGEGEMHEPQEEESGSSYGRQKEDLPTEDEEIDVDDEDSTASNEPLCLTRNDKVMPEGVWMPSLVGGHGQGQGPPPPTPHGHGHHGPGPGDYMESLGLHLTPSSVLGQRMVYMSQYMPQFAAACVAGFPSTSAYQGNPEDRKKRNRTFIDPVTEVPRLEAWYQGNSHPSHSLIIRYTQELNSMPYRQKFPKLEPKNVQFWFKNRRAKCKRLKILSEKYLDSNGV